MSDASASVIASADAIESASIGQPLSTPASIYAAVYHELDQRKRDDREAARNLVASKAAYCRTSSEHLAWMRGEIRAAMLRGKRYRDASVAARDAGDDAAYGEALSKAWISMGSAGGLIAAWNHLTQDQRTAEHFIRDMRLERVVLAGRE